MYNGPGGAGGSGGVVEQCLCVLVNLSRCCQKTRQQLVQSEGIVRRVSTILVNNSKKNNDIIIYGAILCLC